MTLLTALPRMWQSASPWLPLLRPLAWGYGAVVHLRHALYDAGVFMPQRLDVPVIVVGNRIVGGAGKTPALLALLDCLKSEGWRPGVVSRGYGSSQQGSRGVTVNMDAANIGDEPALIHRRSGVPVWVGADRVHAARALRHAHPEVNVILSDDGLQHLRLARDVEVVVFDERGAGNGALLPAGPLREPIDTPCRGINIVLYNAASPSTALPGFTAQRRLTGAVALHEWWRGKAARPATLATLRSQPVLAVAGIAQPQRFFSGLRDAGLSVEELPLPDHFDHAQAPWPREARYVVVTEKDAIKLNPARLAHTHPLSQVWVVPLQLCPESGFFEAVLTALAHRRAGLSL